MTTKLSAKEAAKEIGTDARTLRKFIRGAKNLPIAPVGQGARYEFTPKEVKALKKAFISWSSKTKITGSNKEVAENTAHDLNTKDENGFTDEDYAEHQGIDLDSYDGTTAEPEISEEDLDEDEKELDALEGPTDEELEDLDIEDIDLD